jgi:hypothetical protein
MDFKAMKDYVALDKELRAAKDRVSELEARITPLKEVVLTRLIDSGVTSIHIDDVTVYIRHTVWARSGPSKEATLAALREMGYDLEAVASVNAQKLSAIVREYMGDEGTLDNVPEGLAKSIVISQTMECSIRKS